MATVTACRTRSGRDFSGFNTTLEYLQDIVVGGNFTQFYYDILQNEAELNESNRVPRSLQNARPRRNLVINPDTTFSATKWPTNVLGIFVHVSGVRPGGTRTCDYGSRRFGSATVITSTVYRGDLKANYRYSCSCCMWDGNMTKCKLRPGN